MKLSDHVVRRLADWGVRHVFLVSGGAAMHLNDSLGSEHRIRLVCNHHEQAAAMAAGGYARVTGTIGVVNVTSGPGGINALNGVFGAWTDSVPLLVLSGQVKRETCMATCGLTSLRQLGDQEVDIIRMAQGVTKHTVLVDDPASIRYHLERAYYLAQSGRPGPCWLDLPVDVQAAQIEEQRLCGYSPSQDRQGWEEAPIGPLCDRLIDRVRNAARPVILAGSGVRAAGALAEFERVIRKLRIPVTTAWTHDLIASDDELFCGRPGTIGERAGNLTVQNSDVLIILGSRLNIRQIGYNWRSFAREAFKIQVDVDKAELEKPTVSPDLPIHCDLKMFLAELDCRLDLGWTPVPAHSEWLRWCKERVTVRSYLYAGDLAEWLWTILVGGESCRPYNVGSEEEITIAQLAALVSRTLLGVQALSVHEQPSPDRPADRYVPSTSRARRELGLKQWVPLPEAIRRTAAWASYHIQPELQRP